MAKLKGLWKLVDICGILKGRREFDGGNLCAVRGECEDDDGLFTATSVEYYDDL